MYDSTIGSKFGCWSCRVGLLPICSYRAPGSSCRSVSFEAVDIWPNFPVLLTPTGYLADEIGSMLAEPPLRQLMRISVLDLSQPFGSRKPYAIKVWPQ